MPDYENGHLAPLSDDRPMTRSFSPTRELINGYVRWRTDWPMHFKYSSVECLAIDRG